MCRGKSSCNSRFSVNLALKRQCLGFDYHSLTYFVGWHSESYAPTKCLTGTRWDSSEEGPVCAEVGTCRENDKTCECYITIDRRLTMMMTLPNPVLVWPKGGNLYRFDDIRGTSPLSKDVIKNTITADGVGS